VNSLAVEQWWGDRPVRLWMARRLYDYQHRKEIRGESTRPWVLVGDVCGRGPDNEPLVRCRRPVGWISGTGMQESVRMVEAQGSTSGDRWIGGPGHDRVQALPYVTAASSRPV
jgi:hypothetical protein